MFYKIDEMDKKDFYKRIRLIRNLTAHGVFSEEEANFLYRNLAANYFETKITAMVSKKLNKYSNLIVSGR